MKKIQIQPNNIKYSYGLPNSLIESGIEHILVGTNIPNAPNTRIFSIDEWFQLFEMGSLLPFVCQKLPRKLKYYEYLPIYQKPNLLKTKAYILSLTDPKLICQECFWAIQLHQLSKIYNIDVFKEYTLNDAQDLLNQLKLLIPSTFKINDI